MAKIRFEKKYYEMDYLIEIYDIFCAIIDIDYDCLSYIALSPNYRMD